MSKEKAIKLRKQGWKLQDIADELCKAKSTISLWTKGVNSEKLKFDKEILEPMIDKGFSQVEIAKKLNVPLGSVDYILKRTGLTTKGKTHYENCMICEKESKGRRLCNTCVSKVARVRNKSKAIKCLGGICKRCGWEPTQEEQAAMEFHHTGEEKKEFAIGTKLNRKWSSIKKELDKCELLCSRCHRITHDQRNFDKKIIKEAHTSVRI